jgi:serine/threonine protein kinase
MAGEGSSRGLRRQSSATVCAEFNYRLGKTMGFGAFSKVKSATHSLTGKKVAIKIMNRHKMKDMEEKGIFSCCPSVFIIHFLPSFMTMLVLAQTCSAMSALLLSIQSLSGWNPRNRDCSLGRDVSDQWFLHEMGFHFYVENSIQWHPSVYPIDGEFREQWVSHLNRHGKFFFFFSAFR